MNTDRSKKNNFRLSTSFKPLSLAFGLYIPILSSTATAALPPDSVLKITDSTVSIDNITPAPNFSGYEHNAGISIGKNGSASYVANTINIQTLDRGIYIEGEGANLDIGNPSSDIDISVITNKPNNSINARAIGIWLYNSTTDGSGTLTLQGRSLNIYAEHSAATAQGICYSSKQTSHVFAENINILAVNKGETTMSNAMAVSLNESGTLNIGDERTSLLHLEARGIANSENNLGRYANAINASAGNLVVRGKQIELISDGSLSSSVRADNSSHVSIGDPGAILNIRSHSSQHEARGMSISNGANVILQGKYIGINSEGPLSIGIDNKSGGSITTSNQDADLIINSTGSGEVVGIRSEGENSSVNIKADTIFIETSNTEEDGYSIGLMALNNTQSSTRPDSSASIGITANQTVIRADGVGISAYSNSRVNLNTGLVIDAPTAIEARGNSLVDINPEMDKTVIINGNVSFATTASGSGNLLDAEVRLNLTGAGSSWTGGIQRDYPSTLSDEDKAIHTGVSLTLADQAQWTPGMIEGNAASDDTNAIESLALNTLHFEDGVINIKNSAQTVEVINMDGEGGTINAAASVQDGRISTGTLAVEKIASPAEGKARLAVNYTGITADDLTSENVSGLHALDLPDEAEAVETIENVAEGDVRGAWTRTDGEGAGSYEDNTKLEAFKGVNASALVQWRNQVNHLTKRLGDVRAQADGIGAWARVYGGEYKWGGSNEVDMKSATIQVGGDGRIGDWIVGGAFSYTDSSFDLDNGDGDGDLYSLAVYGTRMFDSGAYIDLVARYGFIKNDLTAGNMDVDFKSNAFGVSVESGHLFKFMERAYVEPQIEVSYGYAQGDDAKASNGVTIEQDDYQSLVTRIGLRTGFDFPEDAGTIYAHVSYSYDFLGDADGTASKDGIRASLDEDLGGGWVTYGIGGQVKIGETSFAYADLERTTGGDVENPWAVNIGFRHVF